MRGFFLVFLILTSCARSNIRINDYSSLSGKGVIAVLPFENLSNDLTAETMLRDMVIKGLNRKGWFVLSREAVDEKLKTIGITDGGQLNAITPKELANLLACSYLFYGRIDDFKFQNLGYVIRKKVEISGKIVRSSDEAVLFDGTDSSSDTKVFLKSDEAREAFIKYNALKLVENIMERPLYKESVEAVDKLLSKIP